MLSLENMAKYLTYLLSTFEGSRHSHTLKTALNAFRGKFFSFEDRHLL